ncbi:MAG: AAA family ATPase [Deltaproteobacteria bacterium]|nr:AAA family ATPase [Deltaproteobacteria bacterium]MBW1921835.1 AAA family ATPase [Deltaproteobacteria bacterium]MBW1947998.1 AAA family ATPase [Deltaproteobacteria bacterium]MBW2008831.1 AAA family ATPase [Deltaproteobacteria bacterium]MBW2102036.1 AAA family ATPase [Deltaproteobacteria bacterium]
MDMESRYLEHLGLSFNPFPVAPDVENFFLSHTIDRLITEIVHGVLTRKGFMVLTGEVGLGKTTISRKILGILKEKGVETSLVFHTAYKDAELLREINLDFGLQSEGTGFAEQMRLLNDFLLERNRQGKNCAVIIDDAQNLDLESFELVRMISNLETDRRKLVQILFVGQPELIRKLERPELRQLKSRVVIQKETSPLDRGELHDYLLFKLNAAGSRGRTVIRKSATRNIHRITRGNFRKINMLMDRCLYAAFLQDTTVIDRNVVSAAYRDLEGERSVLTRRGLAWTGAAFLAALSLIGALYWNESRTPPVMASSGSAGRTGAVALETSQPVKGGTGARERPAASKRTPVFADRAETPSPLNEFLKSYGLLHYADDLTKALASGRFEMPADKIFEETGLRLVVLSSLPAHVRARYGIFVVPAGTSGKETYLLFWKPPFLLPSLHFGRRGAGVARLQELLKETGLYAEAVDGIFGGKTWKAILAFQASMGLPKTGFPDPATLFLLCHSEERNAVS